MERFRNRSLPRHGRGYSLLSFNLGSNADNTPVKFYFDKKSGLQINRGVVAEEEGFEPPSESPR